MLWSLTSLFQITSLQRFTTVVGDYINTMKTNCSIRITILPLINEKLLIDNFSLLTCLRVSVVWEMDRNQNSNRKSSFSLWYIQQRLLQTCNKWIHANLDQMDSSTIDGNVELFLLYSFYSFELLCPTKLSIIVIILE